MAGEPVPRRRSWSWLRASAPEAAQPRAAAACCPSVAKSQNLLTITSPSASCTGPGAVVRSGVPCGQWRRPPVSRGVGAGAEGGRECGSPLPGLRRPRCVPSGARGSTGRTHRPARVQPGRSGTPGCSRVRGRSWAAFFAEGATLGAPQATQVADRTWKALRAAGVAESPLDEAFFDRLVTDDCPSLNSGRVSAALASLRAGLGPYAASVPAARDVLDRAARTTSGML